MPTDKSNVVSVRCSTRERKVKSDPDFLYGKDAQRKKRMKTTSQNQSTATSSNVNNRQGLRSTSARRQNSVSKNISSHNSSDTPKRNSEKKTTESRQKKQGRIVKHRHTSKLYRDLQKAKQELHEEKRRAERFKRRFLRLKQKMDDEIDTKKKVKEIIGKRNVPKDITNFVEVSVALQEDLTNSFQSLKSRKEKGKLINCLQFENLQSVKGLNKGTQFLPRGARRKLQTKAKPNAAHRVNQAKVHEYWLSDLASTECPGKKQTMTIKKKKHQLRYMNASRKRLFKMFKNNNQDSTVKYGIFCKYKPAWIVRPKVSERDTCLCTSCENIKLKIAALHKHEIINENDADKALDSICCESGKVECLLRLCSQCVDKKLKVNEFEQNKFIDYEVWMSIQENRTNAKTKNDFTVKRTVLQTVTTSLQNLVNAVTTDIEEHAKHIGRHYHQYQAVKKKLDNLSNEVLVLKIDYSENYACKYSKEVQGVHFGASRNQVTIHTGVKYTKDCKQAFATVSPDLAHDATATMVHLQPILKAALKENPAVKELVICSDSPSTQYRNKTIFGLIIQHFGVEYPQLQRFSWNYSESGHGKGPADGVGAVLKRTADSLVMSNSNIDTFDKLVTELLNEENIQHVNIIPISANAINNFKKSYTGQDIQFQGTLKVHQVTWDRSKGDLLSFRELSCFECDYGSDCRHYHLGSKKFIAKEILSNNGVAGKKQANQTSSRGRSATKTTVSKSSEKAPTALPDVNKSSEKETTAPPAVDKNSEKETTAPPAVDKNSEKETTAPPAVIKNSEKVPVPPAANKSSEKATTAPAATRVLRNRQKLNLEVYYGESLN